MTALALAAAVANAAAVAWALTRQTEEDQP